MSWAGMLRTAVGGSGQRAINPSIAARPIAGAGARSVSIRHSFSESRQKASG